MEPNQLHDEERCRQGQSLLDGIQAALARNAEDMQTTLRTLGGSPAALAESADAPAAQTAQLEDAPPTVGLTEGQMNAQGHRVQRTGLFG